MRQQVDLLKFPLTNEGNAQRLLELAGDQLMYSIDIEPRRRDGRLRRGWLVLAGTHWVPNPDELVRLMAMATIKGLQEQAITAGNESAKKFADQSLHLRPIGAMLAAAARMERARLEAESVATCQ